MAGGPETVWTTYPLTYQPGEYQPNALDDREGRNFQILANAILYSTGAEAGTATAAPDASNADAGVAPDDGAGTDPTSTDDPGAEVAPAPDDGASADAPTEPAAAEPSTGEPAPGGGTPDEPSEGTGSDGDEPSPDEPLHVPGDQREAPLPDDPGNADGSGGAADAPAPTLTSNPQPAGQPTATASGTAASATANDATTAPDEASENSGCSFTQTAQPTQSTLGWLFALATVEIGTQCRRPGRPRR